VSITLHNILLSGETLVVRNSIAVIKRIGIEGLIKSIHQHISKYKKTNKINKIVFNNYQEDFESVSPFIFDDTFFCEWYEKERQRKQFYFIFGSIPQKNEGYREYSAKKDFYFYPWSFLYEVGHETEYWSVNVNQDNTIKNKFISLNNTPRPHRIKFIDKLHKNNLLNDIVISFNGLFQNSFSDFKYWKNPKRIKLDTNDDELNIVKDGKKNIFTRIPNEYNQAYLDIITETSSKEVMYTEKTLRAILLKKPFIILGAPYVNTKLKTIFNFKLFDCIFDYEEYDSIIDIDNRIDYLCDWMKTFSISDSNRRKIENITNYNRKRLDELRNITKYFYSMNNDVISEKKILSNIGFSKKEFPW
jgi:hypothetical protein